MKYARVERVVVPVDRRSNSRNNVRTPVFDEINEFLKKKDILGESSLLSSKALPEQLEEYVSKSPIRQRDALPIQYEVASLKQ